MRRELEKYIVGCDSREMQQFIRELDEKSLIILYNEAGVYAKRKFEGNISKRMLFFLKQKSSLRVSAEEIQEAEEKAVLFFRSEDFTEYRNIRLKVALPVMRVMRKKKFPEKYIESFRWANFEDADIVANISNSWYDIFLFEETYGFPKNSVIPYMENHKVKLCVLVHEQEYVIGELICFSAFWNMLPEKEIIQLAEKVRCEVISNGETERLPKKFELKVWQKVFKETYDRLKESGFENDWVVIYQNMDKLGRAMISKKIIPEGTTINLWMQGGSYLQFTFYESYTLADVVNPYQYERYAVIDEEAIEDDDFTGLKVWSLTDCMGMNKIGKPMRMKNTEYGDMYFETINGV